jgi:hypothetical protein
MRPTVSSFWKFLTTQEECRDDQQADMGENKNDLDGVGMPDETFVATD